MTANQDAINQAILQERERCLNAIDQVANFTLTVAESAGRSGTDRLAPTVGALNLVKMFVSGDTRQQIMVPVVTPSE